MDELKEIGIVVLGQYKKIIRTRDMMCGMKGSATTMSLSGFLKADDDDDEMIDPSELELVSKVGGGHFGEVWLAMWNKKSKVAVKWLKETSTEDFLAEIKLLRKVRHPHVLGYYGISQDPETGVVRLVTEFMEEGSLLSWLRQDSCDSPCSSLVKAAIDVAAGMDYLAKKGILHRDLAARNILIRKEGPTDVVCKLCDFGLGKALDGGNYYKVSNSVDLMLPVKWTAPEAMTHKKFSVQSDVFAYGVVMWEIFSHGEEPYADWPVSTVLKRVTAGERLEMPFGCPEKAYDLMLECWQLKPKDRPSFGSLHDKLGDILEEELQLEPQEDEDGHDYEDGNDQYVATDDPYEPSEDLYAATAKQASPSTSKPPQKKVPVFAETKSEPLPSRSSGGEQSRSTYKSADDVAAMQQTKTENNGDAESLFVPELECGLDERDLDDIPAVQRVRISTDYVQINDKPLRSSTGDGGGKKHRFQAETSVVRQREANEAFTIEMLNEKEPAQKWLQINYELGTFEEAKRKAMAEKKAIYMSIMVNGPEPEVSCLGSRLFKCTVLSDDRIIQRLNEDFVCFSLNVSEMSFPEESALKDHIFWYKKLQPKSSRAFDSENLIHVDEKGETALLGTVNMAQKDFAHFFSFEKFSKFIDKCVVKRSLLLGIKEEKSVFGKLGKKYNVKKADMRAKGNQVKGFLAFKKQVDAVPLTELAMQRLEYNGLLKNKTPN